MTDFSLSDGSELDRHEGLPAFKETQFAPSGWSIGTARTARIGEGPTELWFISRTGEVINSAQVPDATSQIAAGPDCWYVGCRDGSTGRLSGAGRRLGRPMIRTIDTRVRAPTT